MVSKWKRSEEQPRKARISCILDRLLYSASRSDLAAGGCEIARRNLISHAGILHRSYRKHGHWDISNVRTPRLRFFIIVDQILLLSAFFLTLEPLLTLSTAHLASEGDGNRQGDRLAKILTYL